jgi:hypothetical protein
MEEKEIVLNDTAKKEATELLKKARDGQEKIAKEDAKPNPEIEKAFKEAMEKIGMPVVLDDENFEMGKGELDVRTLSDKNFRQLMWREMIALVCYLKGETNYLYSIHMLMIVLLNKLGVDNKTLPTEIARILKENQDITKSLQDEIKKEKKA